MLKLSTKIPLLSVAGILTLSTLVGGGTFALFTSSSQNTTNTFTAGTLNITPERNDVPQAGPMFYTSTSSQQAGVIPTGLWAPGDQHTRGLFLENTGSLTAQLTTLNAVPANASGDAVSTGSTLANDLTFANQANVKIWKVVAYNPKTGVEGELISLNSTMLEKIVDLINTKSNEWIKNHPTADLSLQSDQSLLFDFINQDLFQDINSISATQTNGTTVTTDSVKVVQMVDEPLINLVNTNAQVPSNMDVTVSPHHAALLAFTVGFDLRPPTGSGIDPNSMQGKSVYFNFGTNWTQTRNNPLPSGISSTSTVA